MKNKIASQEDSNMGIGFKNFRRFEEFPLLEFGPITYMVGRNNAGKSTMVKALLLVLDYLQNQLAESFSFDNTVLEDANIVTFGRALNFNSKSPVIEFKLKIGDYEFKIKISGSDDQTKVRVNLLELFDNKEGYFLGVYYLSNEIRIRKEKNVQENSFTQSDQLSAIQKEIKSLKNDLKGLDSKVSKEALKITNQINSLKRKKEDFANVQHEKEEFEFDLKYKIQFDQFDYFEEEIFPDDWEWPELEGVLHTEEMEYAHKEYDYEAALTEKYDLVPPKTEENALKELLSTFLYQNTIAYKKYLDKRDKVINPFGLTNEYSDIIALYNKQNEIKSWLDGVVTTINGKNFFYLGANPSKQTALFSLRDKQNPLAQAIHEFKQSGIEPGEKEWNFVKEWMKKFEVGENFEIFFYAGEAYEFHVLSGKNKGHLADMGMGSLQVMVIILRLATLIRLNEGYKKEITIIVEEPELNLHPGLQSKLTDLFLYVHKFHHIKFLIETHSEYMIRQSQLSGLENNFFSDQGINPNPFKVYYFHKDEGPYEMIYKEDSKFERSFGEGFFNVADDLAVKAYKINLMQKKNA